MQRLTGHFTRLVVTVLLAALFSSSTAADIALEHVDGLPGTFFYPAMSGDGEWIVWKDATNPPVIGIQNLNTGVQALLDLRTTTGDTGLKFKSGSGYLSVNHDGTRIAVPTADDGLSVPNIVLVVDASGTEVARLTVLSAFDAPESLDDSIKIDKSGRYVVFSVGTGFGEAATLTSAIAGGGGMTIGTTEITRDVFHFDTVSGAIEPVSLDENDFETDSHTDPQGISDGGRYVLFDSYASNLPGADGAAQAYVRDMTKSGAESVEHVSMDPDGLAHNYFGTPYLSDDGSRVLMYHRINDPLAEGNHILRDYLWERGKGTRELTEFSTTDYYDRHLSGDGRWAVGGREVFSRLNVDTGGIYTFAGADDDSQTLIDKPIQSSNGEVLLFKNTSLTTPPGEDGDWWLLRYDALPNLEAMVSETITVNDDVQVIAPINITVNETIYLTDEELVLPAITISMLETITVNDDVQVIAPINITVNETIYLIDEFLVLPAITISVLETIKVNDEPLFDIDEPLCDIDEYVSSNACVACPAGTTNAPGDDPSGADTQCDVVSCNVKIVPGTTEYSDATHEACEILVLGPDFIAADPANVSANSGWEIEFLPGFMVEQGATLNANICGQSLCMTSPSPMPLGCHSCVDLICTSDASCCGIAFDQSCLDMVDSLCHLVCE